MKKNLVIVLLLCFSLNPWASRAGDIGGARVVTPTPGSTVTITISTDARHTIATWTAAEAETVNVSGTPLDGATMTWIIVNDATLGRVITLGTGTLGIGIVTGIISKKSTIAFVAYGGTFHETGRAVGL